MKLLRQAGRRLSIAFGVALAQLGVVGLHLLLIVCAFGALVSMCSFLSW